MSRLKGIVYCVPSLTASGSIKSGSKGEFTVDLKAVRDSGLHSLTQHQNVTFAVDPTSGSAVQLRLD